MASMTEFSALVCGNRAFVEKDYSSAIKHYTAALEEDEEDINALCNRSAAYCAMELYKTSVKDAEAAISIDENCTKAWERKGLALDKMGKRKEAEKAWTKALLIGGDLDVYMNVLRHLGLGGQLPPSPIAAAPAAAAPVSPKPQAQAAPVAKPAAQPVAQAKPAAAASPKAAAKAVPAAKVVTKKTGGAVEEDERLLAAATGREDASALSLSASQRIDHNDPNQIAALAAAQNLISHGIGNASTDEQIALGYLQVNTGNYREGTAIFNHLLEQHPKLIAAYLGRGTANALQGNLSAATKDFSAAIDIDPNVADAWKRRGQTRAALGFDSEAVKDLTKAAAISPDHECFHQRGIVFHKTHDYRKGLADFRKALDLQANNHITWNFVGLCENALGRTREAVIAYERATKIEPKFKEAWANLAQAYRDNGDRSNAEIYFQKALSVDASYVHGYHLRGLLYYGCGEIRLALADFKRGCEVDPSDRNCQLMHCVCLHSLGQFSAAVAEYNALLKLDPGHQCYYQKELALYLHRRMEADMMVVNPDVELDPYFKEAYCKRHQTNHPRLCNYQPQRNLNHKIPDVVLQDGTTSEQMKILVEAARKYGKLIQLRTPGFLSNVRQHRMCGLAIIHMAQEARAWWRQAPRRELGGKGKKGGGGKDDGEKEMLYFDPKGSSKENSKPHDYGWRDWIDICVKWRQISEPNDPVFWIDLLAPEAFAEGFGLQTPMVTGQMNVVRYFPYFRRALEVVKKLIADSGACNVHDQRFMLPRSKLDSLQEATNCHDLWDVMQQGFYVETPCHSIARPGKIMAGTRITLLQKAPDGFDFTIRTPGTPPRWVEMDQEMGHVWRLLTMEARRKPAPDLDKFTELALSFYFYWVNFGPLSRGTAACGYIAFFALMLSIDYEVMTSPPEGTQVDWPAILTPRPSEFVEEVKPWIYPHRVKTDLLDELPRVAGNVASIRQMIEALNAV